MLQPTLVSEAVGAAMTLPSMELQTTAPPSLKDSAEAAMTLASPTTVLRHLMTSEPTDQDLAATTSQSQCPATLGNPASILPFLMAQASSVFSIASGKETGFQAGGIATSSTHTSSDPREGKKDSGPADSSLPVSLDLGNGWKVVGLTSLADMANQTSQRTVPVATSTEMPAPIAADVNVACPSSSTIKLASFGYDDATTSTSLTSSGSSEWKIVGLTSLSPSVSGNAFAVTGDAHDNGSTATAPWDLSSAGPVSPSASVSQQNSCSCSYSSVRCKSCEQSGASARSGVSSDLRLPSLADLAAGTTDWKIAGITTLPVSAGVGSSTVAAAPVHSTPTDILSSPPTLPVSSANSQQWKVVGLTSLHSPPQPPPPPVALPSLPPPEVTAPITPIPVLMAPAAPLVAVPVPPPAAVVGEGSGDEGWKVVGMVPLPQSDKELAKPVDTSSPPGQEDSCQEAGVTCATSAKPASSDAWASNLLHQALGKASQQSEDKSCSSSATAHTDPGDSKADAKPRVSSMLTRNTHNRVWASDLLSQRQWRRGKEDSSSSAKSNPRHPLAFLKNCSNQFRNAVLKKNTVSTMLELKRAFENVGEEDKLVTFLGRKRVFTLSKHGNTRSVFPERGQEKGKAVRHKEESSRNSEPSHCTCEAADSDLPSTNRPTAAKYMQLVSDSGSESEADDKMVLANAYRGQRNTQTRTSMAPSKNFVFVHAQDTSHDKDRCALADETDAKSQGSVDSCVRVIKAESGEEVMNIRGFDCDNVNITNVDPWGVCTDEDLDEIAEMMSDRRGNKTPHSSSRKRKLSTPRKMVQ